MIDSMTPVALKLLPLEKHYLSGSKKERKKKEGKELVYYTLECNK
jgi:hypothetical protein